MTFSLKQAIKPIVIAGPCSAETEEQVFLTAQQIAATKKVDILRAGIWKPRTRPGNFEGIGEKGLDWLTQAGKEFNIPVTTEVANAKHVEMALKKGVDILWIGARTTVNPFSVQEIADALRGVNIPIMIKNPINPEVQLWIGAIERIMKAGVNDIAAIHRGFSSFEKTKFRNDPKWGIPIELMRIFPDLPIICDPSHIGGKKELIHSISQKALDMNMSGLMIETHHTPSDAWSDAEQQITPARLEEILNQLIVRDKDPKNNSISSILDEYRNQIDDVDQQILEILAKRLSVIAEIGLYKKENNTTILQPDRWFDILKTRKEIAENLSLSEEFTDRLLKLIHKESVRIQTKIMND